MSKSYKPIPTYWSDPLTKWEHYCCHMLREEGCDCDIPKLKFPLMREGFEPRICFCTKCETEATLNVTESEVGDYNFPPVDHRKNLRQ
jgi:hypothetical protein